MAVKGLKTDASSSAGARSRPGHQTDLWGLKTVLWSGREPVFPYEIIAGPRENPRRTPPQGTEGASMGGGPVLRWSLARF